MAFCCQLLLLLCPAASLYIMLLPLLPLLVRGSSGGAGMAACGGGSGSSSSGISGGGSGAILFLVVVVILLLFARPPCQHRPSPFIVPCSFCRPPIACLQRAMVCCCLRLSAALFVVACQSAIVNDCVVGHRPPVHLDALVLPAAGAFVALWSSKASSSLSSRSHGHC